MRLHSRRLDSITYSIREIEDFARNYERKEKLTYLNIGDPVKLGMKTANHVVDAAVMSLKRGNNFYAKSDGADIARESISNFYADRGMHISKDRVYITTGVTEAIRMLYLSIFNRNERIALPRPYYPLYNALSLLYNVKPVYYNFDEEGYPDVNSVRSALKRGAKAIVLINPNNPIGSSLPLSMLDEIKDAVLSKGAILISDEIYSDMTYGQKMNYALAGSEDERIIALNGISKLFRVPGWRIGWAVFGRHPSFKNVIANFRKLLMLRLSSPTPFQYALPQLLKLCTKTYLRDYMTVLNRNSKIVYDKINSTDVLSVNKIHAAYYAFIRMNWKQKSVSFVKDLIRNQGIVTVPGTGFGKEGYFRIVFAGNRRTLSSSLELIIEEASKHRSV